MVPKRLPVHLPTVSLFVPFSTNVRSCSAGDVFEGSLAHFGSRLVTFLIPCCSFGVPFLIHFDIKILTFVPRARKARTKQSHTQFSHNFEAFWQVSPMSPAFCQYLALNRFGSKPSSYHISSLLKSPIVLGGGGDALRLQSCFFQDTFVHLLFQVLC